MLPVRMRIHCGIGRFCFSFFASVFFVLNVLLAGCGHGARKRWGGSRAEQAPGGQITSQAGGAQRETAPGAGAETRCTMTTARPDLDGKNLGM
jgi:hypothetical protein